MYEGIEYHITGIYKYLIFYKYTVLFEIAISIILDIPTPFFFINNIKLLISLLGVRIHLDLKI